MNVIEFAKMPTEEVLDKLKSSSRGLSQQEAELRNEQYGKNIIQTRKTNWLVILFRQIGGNPLTIILIIATVISYFTGEKTSALYISLMILLSTFLGFWNEYSAEKTVNNLLKKVSLSAIVARDDAKKEIVVSDATIGDIVYLAPGSMVSADLRLIEASNLEMNQSSFTGETESIQKTALQLQDVESLEQCDNIAFMGTTVVSGSGKGVVIAIGKETEFGKIAHQASFVKPETDFQKGLNQFGNLIVKVILILTVAIFAVNFLLGHKPIDSILFALAIAVGLTPKLLPIIVTISLSHGAGKLAKKHVISKQLVAIENLGNMDILCTDKTGTLTEGEIKVADIVSYKNDEKGLLQLSLIANSAIKSDKYYGDAIDVALFKEAENRKLNTLNAKKVFEQPFDYEKRAMFTVIEINGSRTLIVKGSPDSVLKAANGTEKDHNLVLESYTNGLRLAAIAVKQIENKAEYTWDDIKDSELQGFIRFFDQPKKSAASSIKKLNNLNIELKITTGDSDLVAKRICDEIGMDVKGVITNTDFMKLSTEEQKQAVNNNTVFARVTPSQKLRIIELLRENGHTVGYMGDGVNDVLALKNADVGVSVNTGVDVAKDAASIVLMKSGLDVIADGVIEGRKTFSNTIKYILMGTSSNFGNMFSAAVSSFLLPYLPMQPSQILLNNMMYDVSQLSIPTDNVDAETLKKPRHWDINYIRKYMVFFGPISSIYDFLTFGLLLYVFKANESTFQTGWFIESLMTQILVIFIIRTNRVPFFKSKPSKWLLLTCLSMVIFAMTLPYTSLAKGFGFTPLPFIYLVILSAITVSYLLLVMILRRQFLKEID